MAAESNPSIRKYHFQLNPPSQGGNYPPVIVVGADTLTNQNSVYVLSVQSEEVGRVLVSKVAMWWTSE